MKLSDFEACRCLTVDTRMKSNQSSFGDLIAAYTSSSKPSSVKNAYAFLVGKGKLYPEAMYSFIDPVDIPMGWRGYPNSYCAFKAYQKMFQELIEQKVESVIIFEDDCELAPNFDEVLDEISLPVGWDMFYFGGNYMQAESSQVQQYLWKTNGIMCWHAVAIHSRVFPEIVGWTPTTPIDHQCIKIHNRGNTYGVFPSIAVQKAGFSHVEGRYRDYSEFWSIKP